MAKKPLPDLPDTGRVYVDRTRGGWLESRGLERYVPARQRRWAILAFTLAVALAIYLAWRLG